MQNLSYWANTATASFPEAEGNLTYDFVIVGGGIVGFIHAMLLAERGLKVLVVERGKIMACISRDQAGMITRTFDSRYDEDLDTKGPFVLKARFDAAKFAQKRLFALVRRMGGDCDFRAGRSWYGAYTDKISRDSLKGLWRGLSVSGVAAKLKSSKITRATPFAKFMEFTEEGNYNPVKFVMNALNSDIGVQFIDVREESPLQSIEVHGDYVRLTTPKATITAKKVVLATGGPSILTEGLEHLFQPEWCASVALRYTRKLQLNTSCNFFDTPDITTFRAVDERTLLLLGGGPDLNDPEDRERKDKCIADLLKFANTHFGSSYTVLNQWIGPLIDTEDRMPVGGDHPNYPGQIFLALGTGGTGNVNGSLLGLMNTARMVGEKPVWFDGLFNVSRFQKA